MKRLLALCAILAVSQNAVFAATELLENPGLDVLDSDNNPNPALYYDLPVAWNIETDPCSYSPCAIVLTVDAHLTQSVPGTPGQKYQMRGFAYFEGGFAGGVDFLDPLAPNGRGGMPSLTDVFFALEFLDAGNSVLAGSLEFELHDDLSQENTRVEEPAFRRNWYQHVLTAVAPAGTVNVRVRASMIDGEFNIDLPHQAAWVDDFSLQAIPEPASWLLGMLGLAVVGAVRRKR